MPPKAKISRPAGLDLSQSYLQNAPAWAEMPDEIASNSFQLQRNNDRFSTYANGNAAVGPGEVLGAGLFGSDPNFDPGTPPAGGSVLALAASGTPSSTSNNKKRAPPPPDTPTTANHTTPGQYIPRSNDGQSGRTSGSEPQLTNSSSQQQAPASSGTGLFGNSTAQTSNQATGGSSLFGGNNQQQNQPQQSGGLFGGGTTNTTQQQSGGLFGGMSNQQSQPQQTGSLFGGANNQRQQQSQPQQSGGLFSNTNTQQQNQGGNTGSLFGGNNAPQQSNQPGGAGGIFGGGAATQQSNPGGSLFGQGGNTQPRSVFAGSGSGLGNSSTLGTGTNMFARPAQPSTAGSLFGSLANSNQPQPSLLGAAQHSRLNQSAPFGRLSMGQSAAPTNTVGAVKIDLDNLKQTTRFDDCVDEIKQQLEEIDRLVQAQENYCRQIEAFCPKHGDDVNSIAPDVDYIRSKADDVEQALISDAQGVEAQRKNADKDTADLERCHRVITNLTLPQAYQYTGLGSMYGSQQRPPQNTSVPAGEDPSKYDMDLIGNYFVPMASELQQTVNNYANTLTEIESHMRVMESSAMIQAQQIAQQKSGMGGGQPNSDDTVRELADTLRGFEQSILGVAGVVGECREGVNELVLGRLGGGFP